MQLNGANNDTFFVASTSQGHVLYCIYKRVQGRGRPRPFYKRQCVGVEREEGREHTHKLTCSHHFLRHLKVPVLCFTYSVFCHIITITKLIITTHTMSTPNIKHPSPNHTLSQFLHHNKQNQLYSKCYYIFTSLQPALTLSHAY